MSKKVNLQPWIDYFEMLHKYEQQGYLQMEAERQEAYVTRTSLHAMAKGDEPGEQLASGAIIETARRLRAYAAWMASYTAGRPADPLRNFAVHVVKDEQPHDLLYTVLLTRRRRWWRLFLKADAVEVIDYTTKTTEP